MDIKLVNDFFSKPLIHIMATVSTHYAMNRSSDNVMISKATRGISSQRKC